MTRVALARAVSIVGHPVVLLPLAALIAASTGGASPRQLRLVGGGFLALGGIVMGFSWWQVRAGRWTHVDASVRNERRRLNLFLAVVCLLGAMLLRSRQPSMSIGLAASGTLVLVALLSGRWVKVSLHAAFAAFATTLVWPIAPAVVAGVLMTAAVVWSRLALGRHVAADVLTGVLLGVAAGGAWHVCRV
ncbi:MAG TPA: hypothetical protein VFC25_18440 [Verrucomicrobiae bacterium]|nr:hypothetical protein [Verrucomicrobiae bacterium]